MFVFLYINDKDIKFSYNLLSSPISGLVCRHREHASRVRRLVKPPFMIQLLHVTRKMTIQQIKRQPTVN